MREFKLFNVFNMKDQEKMEEWISTYLSDNWRLEKMDSSPKKTEDGTVYREYQVIMNEVGDD